MTDRITQAEFWQMRSSATGTSLREIAEAAASKASGEKMQPAPLNAKRGAILATIKLQPIGKPRMTRRDKWAQRPSVVRYREWADEARRQVNLFSLPANPLRLKIVAYFEMPKSWSKAKRAELAGQPHRQKPDWDNVAKAVQDIFWAEDQVVAEGHVLKFWDDGNGARVEMEVE